MIASQSEDTKENNEEKENFQKIKNKFREENEQTLDSTDIQENSNNNTNDMVSPKKKELKKLNDEEINCFDLDGWDTVFG